MKAITGYERKMYDDITAVRKALERIATALEYLIGSRVEVKTPEETKTPEGDKP